QAQGSAFLPFVSLATYRTQPKSSLIYSVWRLDGPTLAIANNLVDLAMSAEASGLSGQVCIDRRAGNAMFGEGDQGATATEWDLHRAAGFATTAGFTTVEDPNEAEIGTAPAPLRCDNAAIF